MRRSDDVFYLTLIDFLVQVFFFGLLLFAFIKAAHDKTSVKDEALVKQIEKLKQAAGISNIVELTDLTTRLTPARDFKGDVAIIVSAGGSKEVLKMKQFFDSRGGFVEVENKFKDAFGLPPCQYDPNSSPERRQPLAIATIRVRDDVLSFEGSTVELDDLLTQLRFSFIDVQSLGLKEFVRKFGAVLRLRPDCRHFVNVRVETQFLAPMDALGSCFRVARRL